MKPGFAKVLMMRIAKALLLASLWFVGWAQAETCTDYPGICVDQSSLMTPKVGSAVDVTSSSTAPTYTGCFENGTRGCGAQRINCETSHMGFNDPLVNRGVDAVPFASHLHTFFGLVGVDYATDITVKPTTGNSTCDGGTVNRTAYWTPATIDVRTGAAIASVGNLVYYKPEQSVPLDVQRFPENLRLISGDATRNTTTQAASGEVRYQCKTSGANSVPDSLDLIGMKDCPVGAQVWQLLEFNSCLSVDGVLPAGSFSGTISGWRPHATTTPTLMFRSTTLNSNVTDMSAPTGGGGAAAPTMVKYFDGHGSPDARTERVEVTFVALTEGQSATVAGLTWTAGVGGNTAEEVAIAFSGGSPSIDSTDHKSHLAKIGTSGLGSGNCPATHPYVIPHLRYTIEYTITDSELYRNMRLSCDTYKGPGGYCLHGDWRYGWNTDQDHLPWLQMIRHGGDDTNHRGDRDAAGNVISPPYMKYDRVTQ
jgi:hypothetical protein